jgi:glycosyltransferase involved in cell wall biosynthesis
MKRVIRRLMFVTDAPHFGGAEQYILASARSAERRGIEPSILRLRLPIGDADVFVGDRVAGLRVIEIDPSHTARAHRFVRTVRRVLRQERPDGLVINACGRPRFWLMPWLAWQANVPTAWVQQMVDATDHRTLPPRWLGGRIEGLQAWRVPQMLRHRLAATAATSVVVLNAEDGKRVVHWQGVSRDKIRVIPHGVDCERFKFDEKARRVWREQWNVTDRSKRIVIGTAGRLSREKGFDLLIDATARLRQQGFDVLTVIAGQGAERDALERQANDAGIRDRVRFIDFVADMPGFYSALDVFAMVSRTESFGLALAEAMACERPVIATPTAGSRRQLAHRENGHQLDTFELSELADGLAAMIGDAPARQRYGESGRQSVRQHFSSDLTLERTLRALRGSARERSLLRWPGMNDATWRHAWAEDLR